MRILHISVYKWQKAILSIGRFITVETDSKPQSGRRRAAPCPPRVRPLFVTPVGPYSVTDVLAKYLLLTKLDFNK
jgi:hypothetical protein